MKFSTVAVFRLMVLPIEFHSKSLRDLKILSGVYAQRNQTKEVRDERLLFSLLAVD